MRSFVLISLVFMSLSVTHRVISTDVSGRFKRNVVTPDVESMELVKENIEKVDKVVEKTFEEVKEEVAKRVPPEKVDEAVVTVNIAEKEVKKYARRFLSTLLESATNMMSGGITDLFAPAHSNKSVSGYVDFNFTVEKQGK